MPEIKISYSRHAQERKTQKGIHDNEVKRAIQTGAKKIQHDNTILVSYSDLKVVYVKRGETYYIITVMD
jgi:hypothetical protein